MNTRLSATLPLLAVTAAALILALAIIVSSPIIAQGQSSAVQNVELTSSTPGELQITWTVPDPTPSDYRLMWAPEGEGWPSWKDANDDRKGNNYPTGNLSSHTLTDLPHGATYKVKMRAALTRSRPTHGAGHGPAPSPCALKAIRLLRPPT